jgi:MarR family transcriptional regulator, lower aerobic nicotinate degradation pathway regulator
VSDAAEIGPQVGLLLRLAHQRASRTFREALTPLGIDGRLFGVLSALGRLGPSTQARLIAELDADKSAMLRTVDDLEQRGLVERQIVPGDRRARIIALTEAGRESLAAAEETAKATSAALFSSMDADELVALRDTLARFVAEGRGVQETDRR